MTPTERLKQIAARNSMPEIIGASGCFAYVMSPQNLKRKIAGEILNMRYGMAACRRQGWNHGRMVSQYMEAIAMYRAKLRQVSA